MLCRSRNGRDRPGNRKLPMATTDRPILYQCGALPFPIAANGGGGILLVTTRGARRWIIPRGWPIRNLTQAATAAQEAYEEAGLVGSVVGEQPIGLYHYEKRHNARRT